MSFLAVALLLAPPNDAVFAAASPADTSPVGKLVALSPDGAELQTPAGKQVVRDWVALRRPNLARPAPPRGPALLTTTGDRVSGRLLGGDAQALRFRPSFASAEWSVPLSSAAVVWLGTPPADTPTDPAGYPWLGDNRRRDALLFRNGDALRGTLGGFTREAGVTFTPEVGEARTVPLDRLAAVAFNPSLARTRRPKGPYYHLVLRDGTRLDAATATVAGEALKVKTLFGAAAEVPLADVVAVDLYQGKATHLADLKPKKVEQAGFLGTAWPWAANRTVRGEPLRVVTPLGTETFDRGLGTHPRTVLTYDLGGKYRRFEALVGLDAVSGARGRADVRIRVDGRERPLPELRALAAGSAVAVKEDVSGAKELTLVIDFGSGGGVQADVNWAEARVVD